MSGRRGAAWTGRESPCRRLKPESGLNDSCPTSGSLIIIIGMVTALGGQLDPWGAPAPLTLSEVQAPPSSLMVAGDAQWHVAYAPQTSIDASWRQRPSAGNMLANDGSVRFVDFTGEPRRYTVLPFAAPR